LHLLTGAFPFLKPDAGEEGKAFTERWKNGTYADYAIVKATNVHVVPTRFSSVPSHHMQWYRPFAIAYGAAVEKGRLLHGQSVLVGGATGIHGIATVQVALASGASLVYVAGRSREKVSILAALDKRVKPIILDADMSTAKALLSAAIGAGGVDLYVDFLPFVDNDVLTIAGIAQVKDGGTAVLAGGVQAAISLPYGEFLRRQLTISGSFMSTPAAFPICVEMIGSGAVDMTPFTSTDFIGLANINASLEAAGAGHAKESAFHTFMLYPHGK